ncbi:hypothetical protein C8R43DRAFT_961208 [Mycena crocata]|nr:hypothetical protein C8R43DRAFT_961208 [Mycena crocata]
MASSGLSVLNLAKKQQRQLEIIPTKWKDGWEGKLGGETEEYMRYRYYMHYCEGSFAPLVLVLILASGIDTGEMIKAGYLDPNLETHFAFLEKQLASAPQGGPYLCGAKLCGADIMMSYFLIIFTSGLLGYGGLTKETHPRLFAYAEILQASASYKKVVDKIVEIEGEYALLPSA